MLSGKQMFYFRFFQNNLHHFLCQRSFNKWNLPKKVVNETGDLEKHDLGKCSDNWIFCESQAVTYIGALHCCDKSMITMSLDLGSHSPGRGPLAAVVGDWAVYQGAHVAPAPPRDVQRQHPCKHCYIIILCRQTIRGEEKTSCIRWDSDNLFKIPGPTLGEKLGYFQDIYSLTHTRLCHCLIKQDKTHFVTGVTHSDSPPFVSFHTIPSRLMLVPGSQGPRDSGSVRVPASAVLEAICNTRLLGCFIWIVICLIETLCVWFFEWFYESLFRLIFNC